MSLLFFKSLKLFQFFPIISSSFNVHASFPLSSLVLTHLLKFINFFQAWYNMRLYGTFGVLVFMKEGQIRVWGSLLQCTMYTS